MKKIITIALGSMMLLSLAACSKPETQKDPVQDQDPVSEKAEYTGILDEKKDFMIVVESIDGKDAYIFNLPEEGLEISSSTGDKVTVTYTGDIKDIDALLQAVEVKPAE